MGAITDDLMRKPDMWYSDGEPCLLIVPVALPLLTVKSGDATGTTIGRANGVFSIVRDYFNDMSVNQTSMERGIINYNSKSEVLGTWRFGLINRQHPWPYRWHAYRRFW